MSTSISPQNQADLIDKLSVLGQAWSTEIAVFHQAAAAQYGLGITDMRAMTLLMQQGALTAGQLKQALQLTTGAITNLIDRLERRSFVKRVHDKNDRRKVIVEPRFDKIEAQNVYESIGAAFQKFHQTFSVRELELLIHYLETSVEITKAEIAKLQAKKTS